jgi:hypothetical protein
MRMELDHLFVCTTPGAPEAEELVRFGLREGAPNQHPGQGTSCRRFDFVNAMIELFWVSDEQEAQSASSRPTLLWERWIGREGQASPFGICLRPADALNVAPPFPVWEYRPAYLPGPQVMHIGEAPVEEPMWVYLSYMRRAHREVRFVEHPAGIREITGLTLTSPVVLGSAASRRVVEEGILSVKEGPKPLLEIEFDGKRRAATADFRPTLPLVFRF